MINFYTLTDLYKTSKTYTMPYIPYPPANYIKTSQQVVCVVDGNIDSLNRYLSDGWEVVKTIAQHTSTGSSCPSYGRVFFVIEKEITTKI